MSTDATSRLLAFEITIDCVDAAAQSKFWATAVGYVHDDDDPGAGTAWLSDPRKVAPHLALIEVPERKTVKNRVHIDLAVSGEGTDDERWQRIVDEAARLQHAGARVRGEFPPRWIGMADPEGNEFDLC